MASSGNFATWNPLARTNPSLSYAGSTFLQGNTKFAGTTGGNSVGMSTLYMTSGKWYAEFYQSGSPAGGWPAYGIIKAENATEAQNVSNIQNKTYESHITHTGYHSKFGDTNSGTNTGDTFTAGDIIQIAVDIDAGKAWWGKNNTWTQSGDPANGNNPNDTFTAGTEITFYTSAYNGCGYIIINAGQDDTFGGAITATGNADGNGFGVFKYAPPTGFLSLASSNLSISDDIDPAQTDDDYPSKQFGVVTYTGSSTSAQTITGLGFKPDLVWAKMTNSSQRNFLTDTNRGITKHLFSDASSDEETDSSMGNTNPIYTAFNDDGFVFGTSGSGPNDSSRQYVAWCWKGAGGVNASNAEGSTTCSTQANVKGGFSILTYTGTGSAATLGHGLDSAPEFILAKRRSSPDQTWKTYHVSMGATKYLTLNDGTSQGTSSGMWNDTAPSTTLISIGNESNVSTTSKDYVIYAWHGVEGYSKFGSYVGNGNSDGSFVYTGFRPRMIFTKRFDGGTENWGVFDTARATYNPTSAHSDGQIVWDTTSAGTAGSTHGVDFLSNGFKLRGTGGLNNQSGGEYIYGAWGDVSFKYNNTF